MFNSTLIISVHTTQNLVNPHLEIQGMEAELNTSSVYTPVLCVHFVQYLLCALECMYVAVNKSSECLTVFNY